MRCDASRAKDESPSSPVFRRRWIFNETVVEQTGCSESRDFISVPWRISQARGRCYGTLGDISTHAYDNGPLFQLRRNQVRSDLPLPQVPSDIVRRYGIGH